MDAKKLEALLLQANDMLADYAVAIDNGQADALPMMVVCNQLAKACEEYSKQFREKANREAGQYGKEGVRVLGFVCKAAETGTKYVHTIPPRIASALEAAEAQAEAYKKMAMATAVPYPFIDPETGEVIFEVVPPIKKSTASVTISKK